MHNVDVDGNSVGGSLLAILLTIFGTLSLNDAALIAGLLAGVTTTIYNVVKIVQTKRK